MVELKKNQRFNSRNEISSLLGGDVQKGIAISKNADVILLFTNLKELYNDNFYPKGTYDYCLYTGIGRIGHQDSLQNNMYDLNMSILNHKKNNRKILIFENQNSGYYFLGEYELTETH